MNNFQYSNGVLGLGEETVWESRSINLFDSEERWQSGPHRLELTSHRLFLHQQTSKLEVSLQSIINAEIKKLERQSAMPGTSRISRQIITRVALQFQDKSSLQIEFDFGGHNEFVDQLNQQLIRKHWLYSHTTNKTISLGIAGIEKKIQDRLDNQDQKINESFKDLKVLMNQAKDMVNLSNVLISKLSKPKLNETAIEEDEEMKKLKTCFMNMGLVDNPVTKESSGSKYHKDLALEIYNTLFKKISDQGGIMTLVDAFCLLNRARAIAGLISPEDHLNACKQLNKLNVNLKYNVYADLNLHVLEIPQSNLNNQLNEEINRLINENESVSAFDLSKFLSCNLIVAKKYLLDLEMSGQVCRDDTTLGLRFYLNRFL